MKKNAVYLIRVACSRVLNSIKSFHCYICCKIYEYVHTCMPALFGPQENAWHQLPKHLSQIGIAPAASKLNMQTMFSGSSVCAVTSRSLGCQYQNIVSSYWYRALYFKKFHQPSMKGLVLLFGLVYIRQQSVSIAVTALSVAGISSHQPVSLYRGVKMLWLWTAVDRNTTYETVSLR